MELGLFLLTGAARRMGLLSRHYLCFSFSAVKVSPGTFQFSVSPPLVLLSGTGEFGRVQPLQPFLLTLLLLFLAIVLQKKEKLIPSSGPLCIPYFSAEVAVCSKAVH